MTKSAGCNTPEDRIYIENTVSRPHYYEYINLSPRGMLNDETIEGFGFGQQESAYIREGFGTNGTSAQYGSNGNGGNGNGGNGCSIIFNPQLPFPPFPFPPFPLLPYCALVPFVPKPSRIYADSFMTKSAGCNTPEDRIYIENTVSRPHYYEYINLSPRGMLNDETIEGFGFGQQESAYIREGFGTNGTSAQYGSNGNGGNGNGGNGCSIII